MKVGDLVAFQWENLESKIVDGEKLSLNVADDDEITLLVTIVGDLRFRPKVELKADNDDS
jgi:hypothetical protein